MSRQHSRARHIYIGSFTTGAGGDGTGISLAFQDPESGRLELGGVVAETVSPAFLAWHPNGRFLYAVNERAQGSVVAYEVEDGGGLRELGSSWTSGNGPCHLVVHPSGQYLLTANYGSGSLSVHPIDEDGSVGAHTDVVQHAGSGPVFSRQEGPHAHHVRVDPSGTWVLAVDLGIDAVLAYTLDLATGQLRRGPVAQTRPGSGPRHLAFGDDGVVYVAGELDCSVTAFVLDPASGKLAPAAVASSMSTAPTTDTYPSEIACSDDGRYLYVANRGSDVIGTLAIDGTSMQNVADVPTGGAWPRHLAVVGDHLYVANERSHQVTHFRLDPATGVPIQVDEIEVPSPACILPTPH